MVSRAPARLSTWQTELAVQSPSHGQFFTAHRLHHARLLCPSLSPGVYPSSCQIPYDYTVEVTNGFKGLDIMDRVPKELWTEVHNIVQEAVIKTIPKKKKCKKSKWLWEEALQIAEKRREGKSKLEKERYTHLNAEFQRIARRYKKAFLRDQCKEIEENNRMGKTRDLFKKIRDTKGTLHANMDTIKDRNCMDLTEAEDIKKRWQKKILMTQITTMVWSLA